MKLLVLAFFVALVKGGVVPQLEPMNIYIPEDTTERTEEEWQKIYEAQEYQPENYENYVPGVEPEEPTAGISYAVLPRVINGNNAARAQFPWQAAVILGGTSFCGGSLITTTTVLTAAHCIDGFNHFDLTLGSNLRSQAQTGSISLTSRDFRRHESYSSLLITNDVGLIHLPQAIVLSNFINTVRLPRLSQASETFVNHAAIVSGWGRTSSASNALPTDLQYARVTIIANNACASSFPLNVRASNICTRGASGQSPCNGDSGGPLVIQEADGHYTEVGVVSFGRQNCPADHPAAFARTSSFLQWISTHSGLSLRP